MTILQTHASAAGIFDNFSDGQLADALGDVRFETETLREREQAIRAEFLARGLDRVEGQRFDARKVEAARWSLDTERVKREMGEDWYTVHSRVTPTVCLRVVARKVAVAVALGAAA